MIPVSFGGNAINDITNYESLIELDGYGLPLINMVTAQRQGAWPLVSGVKRDEKRISLQVFIRGATVDTLRKQLFQYFDYEDETPKKLIVEDTGGGNDRYVMAVCRGVFPDENMPEKCYHIALVVDGDVRWREIAITTASTWSVTATGQTKVVANGGQDKAFPILKIVPTSSKSIEFQYKRFIIVKWNESKSATDYPVDIVNNGFDTAALVTATKMQADGDDLRVYVDGGEADRWLQDINTATTQVWVNLDFQGVSEKQILAMDISQTTIYVDPVGSGEYPGAGARDVVITDWPNSGIVQIENELITYTGKNNQQRTLTGCLRGAKGTAAATHAAETLIEWIQHDIWIYYDDSTLTVPTVDDGYEPMIELASTNASWNFLNFRDDDHLSRPGTWQTWKNEFYALFYGGNQGATANPWGEIGQWHRSTEDETRVWVENPCGITSANFQSGEKWAWNKDSIDDSYIQSYKSSWEKEYTIPVNAAHDTWTAWSQNETLAPGSNRVGIYMYQQYDVKIEVSQVTLVINNPPTCTIGSEQANYPLSCTITNNTTGDAIEIYFGMLVNDELEVDTDGKTVIYLEENSNQFNSLDLVGGPRAHWLPLDVGNNTLQFDDVGTGNVTITVTWWERYYL